MNHPKNNTARFGLLTAIASLAATACTQLPNSFRLEQQQEMFSSSQKVNTKLDMLWVIDNSPSMAASQKKIREGFRQFADRYMQPTWDIRVAVISQDTYFAHPSFANFLNSVNNEWYSTSSGYQANYLNPSSSNTIKRETPFVSPSWFPRFDSTGRLLDNMKVRHGQPDYGGANPALDVGPSNPSQWARLIPGRHDGPMRAMCWQLNNSPFFSGVSQCHVRDHENRYSGVNDCVQGGSGNLDSSVQCVNTIMNNTVRSGNPIISTQPPAGVAADAAWKQKLYSDFMVNLSGGTSGFGVEKFFNSVDQLIADNELPASSSSKFFRPNSLRVIVFVSDEDDQSMVLPSTQITPLYGYNFYNVNPACPYKTVDGHSYRLQICPQADKLLPVSQFKTGLDSFFRGLDSAEASASANYFVVSIAPQTGAAIKSLHDANGETGGSYGYVSTDRATRVSQLADLVGNHSVKLELTDNDYAPLLDQIGLSIVQNKAVFTLSRSATGQEDMVVWILHGDGTREQLPYSKYTVDGTKLTITDLDIVLTFRADDQILVDYQPRTI